MYHDQTLDNWLDKRAADIVASLGKDKPLTAEDMLVLVLKAQTNHFNHLDVELRQDMQHLRQDMTTDMKHLREDMTTDMKHLREDMDKRFEQVDKRFEQVVLQVDKRFEQVDKRFDMLVGRIDRLMIWSFATTLSVGGMVVTAVKFL